MAERLEISPAMLEWAITRDGHSVQTYKANNENVAAWIDGTKLPTEKQLEEFAKKIHVPFGYLFLPEPPIESSPIPFFRGTANDGHLDLNTYETVLTIQRRQEWLSDYLHDNDFEPCVFVGSVNKRMSTNTIVDKVRRLLNLPCNWAFHLANSEQAVNRIVELLEELGVFIAFNGVVGNNTKRPINVNECRGFVLVDPQAPFIFVNSADSKTAQLFTLIHEFAHILFGFSSGFGGDNWMEENEIEKTCDKVAADFLVPEQTLRDNWMGIESSAKKFKVSPLVIARRAKELGIITYSDFIAFYNEYVANPVITMRRNSGGNFNLVAKKRVGYTFAVHVQNAVRANQLSQVDAYRLTGLYGKTYSSFMSNL